MTNMIPVNHAMSAQPYMAAMASMIPSMPDAPLDLSRSKAHSSAADAPLDLSVKPVKRKSSESDDDVIVVGVQKRPHVDSYSRNTLATQQWQSQSGYGMSPQRHASYAAPHQAMLQRSPVSGYGYGSTQSHSTTTPYSQAYAYSQQRSSVSTGASSHLRSPGAKANDSRALQAAHKQMMGQSSTLQSGLEPGQVVNRHSQDAVSLHMMRQRMLAQQQRQSQASASAASSSQRLDGRHAHPSQQPTRSPQDVMHSHYTASSQNAYSSTSSQPASNRHGSQSSTHNGMTSQQYQQAYHRSRSYVTSATSSPSLSGGSMVQHSYSGQTGYLATGLQQAQRPSMAATYTQPPSSPATERPASGSHPASPGAHLYNSDRISQSRTPSSYPPNSSPYRPLNASHMPAQTVPLNRTPVPQLQRNPVRSLMAAQIAAKQVGPSHQGHFVQPPYPTNQLRHMCSEWQKSSLSPTVSSQSAMYHPAYPYPPKASSYSPQMTKTQHMRYSSGMMKPPSTPPGPLPPIAKPLHNGPVAESSVPTQPSAYSPRLMHSMTYDMKPNISTEQPYPMGSTVDLSAKPHGPSLSIAEPPVPLAYCSMSSSDARSHASTYVHSITCVTTTTVQSKAVSVMSVTSLPDGPRLYRNPGLPNRPPLQNDAAGAQMKFIPVANVNPIVQPTGRTLHPKKQVLYQSRLDDLQKGSPDAALHEDNMEGSLQEDSDVTPSSIKSPTLKPDDCSGDSEELKKQLGELQKVFSDKQRPDNLPGTEVIANTVHLVSKKIRGSQGEGKLRNVPIKERFKVKKMYRMSYHKNDMTKEEIDIKSSICENEVFTEMYKLKENVTNKKNEFDIKPKMKDNTIDNDTDIVTDKSCSKDKSSDPKRVTRRNSTIVEDDSTSYTADVDNDESTVEYEISKTAKEEKEKSNYTEASVIKTSETTTGKGIVKRKRRRRPRDGFARKATRKLAGNQRAKFTKDKDSTKTNIAEAVHKVRIRKQQSSENSSNGQSPDETPAARTIKTRNQAAARPSHGRLSLYNKNASYERELRREEHRKFLLRIKRQSKQQSPKDGNELEVNEEAEHSPKSEKELRTLRPRRSALEDEEQKPKRKLSKARIHGAQQKKYTLRSTPPKRVYWRKRGFLPLAELQQSVPVPGVDLPEVITPGPEAEIISDMKKLVVCKDIGETVMHKAARLGNMKILLHILDTGMFEVDVRDNAGYTPLHESCVKGHLEVAKLLLSRGADASACALDGTAPLHDAVDHSHVEITRLLLAHGADVRNSTCTGRTAMKVAKRIGIKTLLRGFLQDMNGLDDDNPDRIPWTFPSSCSALDPHVDTGCDVFGDVPPDEDIADQDVMFDLSDEPHMPVYHLFLGPEIGYRNYHLLRDITLKLRMNMRDFISVFPTIVIQEMSRDDFSSQVGDNGMNSLDIRMLRNMDMVPVVEVSDKLMSILGITRFTLKSEPVLPLSPLVISPCELDEPQNTSTLMNPNGGLLLDIAPQSRQIAVDCSTGGNKFGILNLSPDHHRSVEAIAQSSFPKLGTVSPSEDDKPVPPAHQPCNPGYVHCVSATDIHNLKKQGTMHPLSNSSTTTHDKFAGDTSKTFTPISPADKPPFRSTASAVVGSTCTTDIGMPVARYPQDIVPLLGCRSDGGTHTSYRSPCGANEGLALQHVSHSVKASSIGGNSHISVTDQASRRTILPVYLVPNSATGEISKSHFTSPTIAASVSNSQAPDADTSLPPQPPCLDIKPISGSTSELVTTAIDKIISTNLQVLRESRVDQKPSNESVPTCPGPDARQTWTNTQGQCHKLHPYHGGLSTDTSSHSFPIGQPTSISYPYQSDNQYNPSRVIVSQSTSISSLEKQVSSLYETCDTQQRIPEPKSLNSSDTCMGPSSCAPTGITCTNPRVAGELVTDIINRELMNVVCGAASTAGVSPTKPMPSCSGTAPLLSSDDTCSREVISDCSSRAVSQWLNSYVHPTMEEATHISTDAAINNSCVDYVTLNSIGGKDENRSNRLNNLPCIPESVPECLSERVLDISSDQDQCSYEGAHGISQFMGPPSFTSGDVTEIRPGDSDVKPGPYLSKNEEEEPDIAQLTIEAC